MKVRLVIAGFIFFLGSVSAQVPSWAWAKSTGTVSNDYSNATCTDANGNVYITGTFQGSTITFGSYTLQNTATGTLDIFIVKYDASGNVLWARKGGGGNNDYAYGICANAKGNVFITGHFLSRSITFGSFILNNTDTTGNCDILIVKYDSLGNELWAKSAQGKGCDVSYGICTNESGDVYITGRFSGNTMNFGSDSLVRIGTYSDIFIAKYDAGGNNLWAFSAGGTQGDGGQAICTDESGNIYLTGYYTSTALFGTFPLKNYSYNGIFIAKMNPLGNVIWAKAAPFLNYSNYENGLGIAANKDNIYITGYFQYPIIFGSDTLGNSGNISMFIAKYDSSGNAVWGRTPGGTGGDYGSAICTDVNGNAYITGYFSSHFLNFGGFPVINSFNGYNDIFVAAYDANGNALWAKSVGGQDNDYGMGICSSGNDVYVTGYFGSYSLNFGSSTVTNVGSYDIFLAKLSTTVGISETFANNVLLSIYPNPSHDNIYIRLSKKLINGRLNIFNAIGEQIYSEVFDSEQKGINLNEGLYLIQVADNNEKWTGKVLIE